MQNINDIGKRIIDIGELLDVFEIQEGEIQQIIGKTGNGKTYEGTRRALEYLKQGYTVYTTWHLILPDYYDERKSFFRVLFSIIFFWKKRFFKLDYKNNWHYLDIDRPDLINFVAGITDAIVFFDEGQDIFDSRGRIDQDTRKVLTRMRHMRKTLIIISQRAQAVDTTARSNATFFYKCVKTRAWFWPFATYFKVYRTEEMDNQNFPIWEDLSTEWEAEVWHSGFASDEVYNSYNSWYLRAGIPKSQEIKFEAYELTFKQKINALLYIIFAPREKKTVSKSFAEKIKELNEEKYRKTITTEHKKPKKSIKDIHKTKSLTIPQEVV